MIPLDYHTPTARAKKPFSRGVITLIGLTLAFVHYGESRSVIWLHEEAYFEAHGAFLQAWIVNELPRRFYEMDRRAGKPLGIAPAPPPVEPAEVERLHLASKLIVPIDWLVALLAPLVAAIALLAFRWDRACVRLAKCVLVPTAVLVGIHIISNTIGYVFLGDFFRYQFAKSMVIEVLVVTFIWLMSKRTTVGNNAEAITA